MWKKYLCFLKNTRSQWTLTTSLVATSQWCTWYLLSFLAMSQTSDTRTLRQTRTKHSSLIKPVKRFGPHLAHSSSANSVKWLLENLDFTSSHKTSQTEQKFSYHPNYYFSFKWIKFCKTPAWSKLKRFKAEWYAITLSKEKRNLSQQTEQLQLDKIWRGTCNCMWLFTPHNSTSLLN